MFAHLHGNFQLDRKKKSETGHGCAETRIPTTPTARKVLQDMKKTQAVAPGANVLIPACKTPGAFPPSTLHNNVNATPRAQAAMVARMAGTATPRKWRAPTPGPQYPITPEEYASSLLGRAVFRCLAPPLILCVALQSVTFLCIFACAW